MLINFELCQISSLATLPLSARTIFDDKFQAPEVLQPGQELSTSSDIYSFGLIIILVLNGDIPFNESISEVSNRAKNSNRYWYDLATKAGVTNSDDFFQRILHRRQKFRPEIDEVINVLNGWIDDERIA